MAANNNHHEKMPSVNTMDYTTSDSSSSTGSGSTPTTPPSPAAVLHSSQMKMVEPHITNEKGISQPKRSPKRTPPKSRLGAIDEQSDSISPDLPARNPRRLLGGVQHTKLFQLAFPQAEPRSPPKKLYDDIKGPNGEKFADVRNNTSPEPRRRGGWKRLVCLGLIMLMVGAVVAIVLIAVLLTRKHKAQNQDVTTGNGSTNASNQGFPAGNYAITQYLTTADTSCTSNPDTWRCYPYQTYNQSTNTNASMSTLNWIISSNSSSSANSSYLISSADALFSYTFQSRPLTLVDNGTENEAYTFTYPYVKTVFPTVALTSDGVTTRCYYNNTMLTAKLYTRKQKEAALISSMNTSSTSTNPQWPYALEFVETIQAGTNVPNCYRYVNGVNGDRVDVATASQIDGWCRCGYTNYGV